MSQTTEADEDDKKEGEEGDGEDEEEVRGDGVDRFGLSDNAEAGEEEGEGEEDEREEKTAITTEGTIPHAMFELFYGRQASHNMVIARSCSVFFVWTCL